MQTIIDINNLSGLSDAEALQNLEKDGFNEVFGSTKVGLFEVFFKTVSEPMFLLLIVGAVLYFILGSKQEAILLLSFVVIIIGITFRQEYKSEKVLLSIRNLSSPRAFVIRDGVGKSIPGREVVVGDLIIIKEGDRIPADSIVLSSNNLFVDESILTGESLPVRKIPAVNLDNTMTKIQTGADDLSLVYSSTYVVQGNAIIKILTIGANTAIGKIGKTLNKIKITRSPLQKDTDYLVRSFAIFGLCFSLLIAILYGWTRGNWLNGFLSGIALAMSILPEEIPAILSIFLALGAWRISQKNVLTRQPPAVEALGSITVLCADKTGTITQNKMSIKKIFAQSEFYDVKSNKNFDVAPEIFHTLIEYSILASQLNPFDPMEIAINELGEQHLSNTEHLHKNWQLVQQYPLQKELMATSLVWKSLDNENYIIAAKGAPETIFDLCHLDKDKMEYFSSQVQLLANEGLRVIGVARTNFKATNLPEKQHDFDFEFLGLLGLEDPVRENVFEAVKNCYAAGIRVIMITGDHVGTAQNVALQVGLKNEEAVLTGAEIATMNDLELMHRIKTTNICARILPEQKLRLVNALKNNGEIVAMTGDGVNDAPALKAANVGVAMGKRGTEVAREAASLVLLDDDFSSIVAAIRLGRRIFDNIKKAILFTIAVHIPIIGLALLPILLRMPLLLWPIHIVFLELIIGPACSLVFEAEPEEKDLMYRQPRNPNESLFNRKTVMHGVWQGLGVLFLATLVFFGIYYLGFAESKVRAITFTTVVLSDLALITVNRSRTTSLSSILFTKNIIFWSIISGAISLLICILYIPFLQRLFYFGSLSFLNLLFCFGVGVMSVFWLKLIKAFSNNWYAVRSK